MSENAAEHLKKWPPSKTLEAADLFKVKLLSEASDVLHAALMNFGF